MAPFKIEMNRLETVELMVFLDNLNTIINEIDKFGYAVGKTHYFKGITEKSAKDIMGVLETDINELLRVKNLLEAEINRRMVKLLGLKKSPLQCLEMIQKYCEKHPLIGKTEEEILKYKEDYKSSLKKV